MPSNHDVYIYNTYTAPRLRFLTFLKEYFDIEIKFEYWSEIKNSNEKIKTIFVYEKNNDCEPLFILRDSFFVTGKENHWVLGNINSSLEHGKEYREKDLIDILK